MDSQRVKRLEQILARRRQIVVSIVEMEPTVREEDQSALAVKSFSPPSEVVV